MRSLLNSVFAFTPLLLSTAASAIRLTPFHRSADWLGRCSLIKYTSVSNQPPSPLPTSRSLSAARVTSVLWPRTRTSRPRFWSARAALRGASGTKTWRRCAGGRGWRLCARRQLLPGGCFALWSACLRRSRAAAAVADACQMSIAPRGASFWGGCVLDTTRCHCRSFSGHGMMLVDSRDCIVWFCSVRQGGCLPV